MLWFSLLAAGLLAGLLVPRRFWWAASGLGCASGVGVWIWEIAQGCDPDSEISCGGQRIFAWIFVLFLLAAWLAGLGVGLVVRRLTSRRRFLGGGLFGRVSRAALVAVAGLVLGVGLYVVLVALGVIPRFHPSASGDLALARSDRAGLRVLFVGNSLTYENDMPELVHELAAADPGARPIFSVQYATGGWRLRWASEDDGLSALLEEVSWDVVVLQEQSRLPSRPPDVRRRELDPFARVLHAKIERAGARTLLFMTWGYEDGDRRVDGDSYEAMQRRLWYGYSDLAAQLRASVAPVGLAWQEALGRQPGLDLWAGDGIHPNRLGSYLTACVFYAVLSHRDPTRSRFADEIAPAEARYLQYIAADVVARNLG